MFGGLRSYIHFWNLYQFKVKNHHTTCLWLCPQLMEFFKKPVFSPCEIKRGSGSGRPSLTPLLYIPSTWPCLLDLPITQYTFNTWSVMFGRHDKPIHLHILRRYFDLLLLWDGSCFVTPVAKQPVRHGWKMWVWLLFFFPWLHYSSWKHEDKPGQGGDSLDLARPWKSQAVAQVTWFCKILQIPIISCQHLLIWGSLAST